MLLKKTNIEEKLINSRAADIKLNHLLEEVQLLLNEDVARQTRIHSSLEEGAPTLANPFVFDLLETDHIYHLNQIKEICIDYRLRFLDTKYFKGEIPQEALNKITALEKAHEIEISGFKIIAPSKLFKLEDKDDPLLFAPIGNNYYYLIHKWGNDLHPLRKLFMWPLKNMVNLLLLTFVASFLLTLIIPNGLFSKTNSTAQFMVLFFFTFKSMVAILIFYGVSLGKNFTPAIWNSKYFNA